jgi:pSer/pThr/pTyr-binding forkhead associated (FHA) protein
MERSSSDFASSPSYGLIFSLPSGEEFTFNSLPITIGRSIENDLVIQRETVSSTHARISYNDAIREICILDLDSLNGIFVDHFPTRLNVLYDGIQIGLGDESVTFRDTGYIHHS